MRQGVYFEVCKFEKKNTLAEGIRQKNIFQPEVFFCEFLSVGNLSYMYYLYHTFSHNYSNVKLSVYVLNSNDWHS